MRKFSTIAVSLVIIPAALFGQKGDKAVNSSFFVSRAIETSPLLKSQKNRIDAADSSYKAESFLGNPVFSFAYSNIPLSQWPKRDAHPMSGISFGISQYFSSPLETIYRRQSFYQKLLSEKESYSELRNMTAFQVQLVYFDLVMKNGKKALLAESESALKSILAVAESLVSVNRMNSAQLLKIRARLSEMENRILVLAGDIAKSQSDMDKLCGESFDWPSLMALFPKGNGPLPEEYTVSDYQPALHPAYRELSARYESQKAMYAREKARLVPGVTVGLEYRLREPIPGRDEGEDFISMSAGIPLPLYYPFKEHHSIRAQKEQQRALGELLKNLKNELESRWRGEKQNEKMLYSAYRNYKTAVLPVYYSSYEANLAALPSGEVSLIDVLDAYRNYLDASMEGLNLYHDLMASRLRLNYLLNSYPSQSGIKQVKSQEADHE